MSLFHDEKGNQNRFRDENFIDNDYVNLKNNKTELEILRFFFGLVQNDPKEILIDSSR